ncbi:MAG: hypothetical protein JWM47_4566 [Acidimicrobiales bacterium]|nr:hypothetical protein [Acidimicrobiales bacterium]
MLAVFHHEQPDGTCVATCATYPNWVTVSASRRDSHQDAEPSLLKHIEKTTTFAHYDVPVENSPLRPVA